MCKRRSPVDCLALSLLLALGASGVIAGPDSTMFDGSSRASSAASAAAAGARSRDGSGGMRSSSSASTGGGSIAFPGGNVLSCNSKSIVSRGNLPVAEVWSESAPLTLDFTPLPRGQCVGYTITQQALAATGCGDKSPENYILVEFWQLGDNSTISGGSIGGPGSGRNGLPKVPYTGPVIDVKVLAARGTKPSLTWGSETTIKVVPPIRDPTTGLTPVGSFQDDAGVVYNRPALRIVFPTDSPVTDVGEPADPNAWYITIANMPDQQPLPAYAIRASCVNINPPVKTPDGRPGTSSKRNSSRSSSSKQGPQGAKGLDGGLPCPVPSPGGKQCNGHGTCRTDSTDLSPEYSRYCACDAGWGSWGCQLQLLSLPVNSPTAVTATIPPGKWGYWEVTLPAWQAPTAGSSGSGSSSSEQLLLMAERLPGPGMGGNPLLFLKPFDNKDHNEPALDSILEGFSFDVVNYADLRSFQLQLNRQFINYRLPLRETRGAGPGSRSLSRPRRWYVAVYNSNASRLSEPTRVKLWVQYRDLNREPLACPFDCNTRGRCVDPLSALQAMRGSLPQGLGPKPPGLNPDVASLMALGPLQDLSPVDAGFMCSCNKGFGGLLCEGRVQNLTIGSGEQRVGPELLEPGSWFYYVVTIDSGFNPNSDNLGIQWVVGQPQSAPGNYSNAYISFDQGPLHRQQQLMGVPRGQAQRRGMTPYTKLIVRSNPPLPLQVPGGQLTPGGTYVVSVFNNDYVISASFMYNLAFYVMAESGSYLHPYMSILLGVTAAVILCLAMTLCKRVVVRYGFLPWRCRQRQRQLQAAAAAGGPAGQNSLALVLLAQAAQNGSRGVPPEIYLAFPCRPYAAKDYQKRQHDAAQQQQQQQGAEAADAAADDVVASRQDQGARRAPTAAVAAAAAAAAATAAANAAALDAGSEVEPARGGTAATAAAATPGPGPEQQQPQQQRWRLPGLPWSNGTAAAAAAPASTPAAAAAAAAALKEEAHAAKAANATSKADGGAAHNDNTAAAADGAKEDDAPSCAVCLCEYVGGELVRQLPCHHEFHQSCIDQWMVSHGTCPICRAPLWPGALEDEQAAEGVSDDRNDDPAAIYVHHDMLAGRGGRAAAAGVGRGALSPGSAADMEWVRALRQWRERNRQQQLQPERLEEDVEAPAAAAGGGALQLSGQGGPDAPGRGETDAVQRQRRRQRQRQQRRQQRLLQQQLERDAVAVEMPPVQQPPPAAAAAAPAAAGAAPAAPDAAGAAAAAVGAAPAEPTAAADDRIMGAFSFGRRRQQQ